MSGAVPADVIGKLREAAAGMNGSIVFKQVVEPRDGVLARYQPVFAIKHIPSLSEEEFKSFLMLENNHHWSGLHRQGPKICSNMAKLRTSLALLVDDSKPLPDRIDQASEMISGMGKNIISAILMVSYPDLYGVWNNRSEWNMKRLGIWPAFDRGVSFGNRYVKVNQILIQLRDALNIDLWTLDSLWWYLDQKEAGELESSSQEDAEERAPIAGTDQVFGLERHLHEFLRDNWDRLPLGKEWEIYKEEGDDEAGYEYPCEVGRIDLLAKHRTKSAWLVIELKRNQTSDQTVGQLLRYIGWVKKNLAESKDKVHGLIICHESDKALQYALSTVQNVELRLYQVDFHLIEPEGIGETKT